MSELQDLEKLMLWHSAEGIQLDDDRSVASLVAHGSYIEALKCSEVQNVFSGVCSNGKLESVLETLLSSHLQSSPSNESEFLVMSIGVASLQLFIQANFTGPMLVPCFAELFPGISFEDTKTDDVDSKIIGESSSDDSEIKNNDHPRVNGLTNGVNKKKSLLEKEVLASLSEDTEGIYSLITCAEYFVLAKVVFGGKSSILLPSCLSHSWWMMRYNMVLQMLADETSSVLHKNITDAMEEVKNSTYLSADGGLKALHYLESCQAHLLYGYTNDAHCHLTQAEQLLRLDYYLTGSMGKRTKYQVDAKPQLHLKVKYIDQSIVEGEQEGPTLLSSDLPKDVMLNDDTRLPHIKFEDEDDGIVPNLKAIEQLALAARVHYSRRASASDMQLKEESKAFLHALLQYPKCWLTQHFALRIRCHTEADEARAADRALQQFEELVASYSREEPSRYERLKFFYASGVQPLWCTKQEYGRLLMQMGCTRTALTLFEDLQLWDDVIDCYNRIGMRQRSEGIIRELLEIEETPKLWCLLGDATDNIEYYVKAFEVSNSRSSRAKRCLGNYYFARKQYKEAIEQFEISVKLNHIQVNVWERLAYAALVTENWKLCVSAYRTCTVIEPHCFEYWNNLAKAHTELKEFDKAYCCLEEALRCKPDSWKMLENVMTVAITLDDYPNSLSAYKRLWQLKPKHINYLVISGLVKPLTEQKSKESLGELYYKQLVQFLSQMCQSVPSESDLWYYYGEAVSHNPNATVESRDLACQHFRKSLATVTRNNTWAKNPADVKRALVKLVRLQEALQASLEGVAAPTALANVRSVSMMVENVMIMSKKGVTNVITGEVMPDIEPDLDRAQKASDAIKATVNNLIEQCKS